MCRTATCATCATTRPTTTRPCELCVCLGVCVFLTLKLLGPSPAVLRGFRIPRFVSPETRDTVAAQVAPLPFDLLDLY